MDYKAMKAEIDSHYSEIYNTYILALKNYMRENAEQTNSFIETLWLDVTEDEIVYQENYDRPDTTIDKIYYIPSKDELGYVIYQEGTNEIFKTASFSPYNLNALSSLFYCTCLHYGSL